MKKASTLLVSLLCFISSALAQTDLKQWMNGLNDNLYISQMSLPGAHDAATENLLVGKCQDKDISELWDAGVRVFDLRPTDADGCPIYHGTLSTGVTLTDALNIIKGKLSAYSSEFAIIFMRNENDGGSTDNWKTRVKAIMSSFSDIVIPLSPYLRLRDVRGKVIVLSRDYYADGYTISGWGHSLPYVEASSNGLSFAVQDYYEVKDKEAKSSAINNILSEARNNTNINRFFINHTSGYVPGLIPGIMNDITGNANTCNTLALNTINANPGPTGIILMDYAGSGSYNGANLCSAIIAQNSDVTTIAPEAAEYYVYNVGRDMYVTRSNNYATRAGVDRAGLVMTVNYGVGSKLALVTNVNGTGRGIFIADGNGETVYVDNTPTLWTFECVDEANQIYTLRNGDSYLQAKDGQTRLEAAALPANKSAQWQFVPRNVREDLSAASFSNPVDVTFLVENQGFDWYSNEQRSWKNADNTLWRPGDAYCRNADASNNCAEVWNANFDIHQSFTGLKNGVYELRVQGYYRISTGNNSDYIAEQMRAGNDVRRARYYINTAEAFLMPQLSAELPADLADYTVDINGTAYRYPNSKAKASIAFREGYYENAPLRAVITDGKLSIGLRLDNKNGEDWTCFDNVRLAYLGLPIAGDINLDGAITIADVTALVNIILGKADGSVQALNHAAADVNADGAVTIADVTALVNIILRK